MHPLCRDLQRSRDVLRRPSEVVMTLVARTVEALERRAALLERLHAEHTDCYRLLHGAVEGLPGTAVDRYGDVLLVQTWREPCTVEAVQATAEAVSEVLGVRLSGVWNHRARSAKGDFARFHPIEPGPHEGRELGLTYDVSPRHRGLDPLLFLDFRGTRRRVRAEAQGKDVLNLFAYTCGIGVAAAAGGARSVLNVDFAASSLEVGLANARANGVEDRFQVLQGDCLPVSRSLAGLPVKARKGKRLPPYPAQEPRQFDLVVLDPPRWATSAFGAVDLVRDYPSVFKPALLATAPGGTLVCTNNVASVEADAWVDVLTRAAAKAGRPIRSLELAPPEEDFPSPDARWPLKVAWLRV